MKKFRLVLLIFTGYFAQAQQEDNPFYKTEKAVDIPKEDPNKDGITAKRGNPPGDNDLPIDDYVPVLVFTAVGMIIYKTYQKRKLLS